MENVSYNSIKTMLDISFTFHDFVMSTSENALRVSGGEDESNVGLSK